MEGLVCKGTGKEPHMPRLPTYPSTFLELACHQWKWFYFTQAVDFSTPSGAQPFTLSKHSSEDICMFPPGCLDNSHKAAHCSAKKLPFQRSRNTQHLLKTHMPETEPTLALFSWRGISVSWGALREQEGSSSLIYALPEVQLQLPQAL